MVKEFGGVLDSIWSLTPNCKQRMIVGLLNHLSRYSTANNIVDMAPSLDEADAILAKFGWAEEAAVAA